MEARVVPVTVARLAGMSARLAAPVPRAPDTLQSHRHRHTDTHADGRGRTWEPPGACLSIRVALSTCNNIYNTHVYRMDDTRLKIAERRARLATASCMTREHNMAHNKSIKHDDDIADTACWQQTQPAGKALQHAPYCCIQTCYMQSHPYTACYTTCCVAMQYTAANRAYRHGRCVCVCVHVCVHIPQSQG